MTPSPSEVAHPVSESASKRASVRVGALRDGGDSGEVMQRLPSLLALLGIYGLGLGAISFLPDGSDIAAVLVGIFGHVVYVGIRTLRSVAGRGSYMALPAESGIFFVGQRSRFIPYGSISRAEATDSGATLVLERGTAPVEMFGVEERHAFVARIERGRREAMRRASLSRAAQVREGIRGSISRLVVAARASLGKQRAA
jgi:hypothetical protein